MSELPPFSAILTRVMASLEDDDVSLAEIGDLPGGAQIGGVVDAAHVAGGVELVGVVRAEAGREESS